MAASITPLMDGLFLSLRAFLKAHLSLSACRQSQQNNTEMPDGNYVIMTPLGIDGLSTNSISYQYTTGADSGTETHKRTAIWRCQLDFYGDAAQDYANIIFTLSRSDYACQWFRDFSESTSNAPPLITPLYCKDPIQTTMVNGEDQWENRWTCDFYAQIPVDVSVTQYFMTSANVRADSVDAKFPPESA